MNNASGAWQGRYRGAVCMVLSSLLFAVSGAAVKFLTARLPVLEVVAFRFAISVAVLIPWMLNRRISLRGKNRAVLMFRSLCGFIAGSLSFYVTSRIALADASLLTCSSPVFVAILSAVFFGENVPPRLFGLILLAGLGAIFVLQPGFDVVNTPGILGLVSAVFSALAYLGIRRLHKTDASATIVLHFSLFSAVASMLIGGRSFLLPTPEECLVLCLCGLCATFGQILMTLAYKFQEASSVSAYSYATVLFSALFGVLFWNEAPGLGTVMGGALMVIAGVGILRMSATKSTISKTAPLQIREAVYE